jgi:hypothetical protein
MKLRKIYNFLLCHESLFENKNKKEGQPHTHTQRKIFKTNLLPIEMPLYEKCP